jgi:hypothetical protein
MKLFTWEVRCELPCNKIISITLETSLNHFLTCRYKRLLLPILHFLDFIMYKMQSNCRIFRLSNLIFRFTRNVYISKPLHSITSIMHQNINGIFYFIYLDLSHDSFDYFTFF